MMVIFHDVDDDVDDDDDGDVGDDDDDDVFYHHCPNPTCSNHSKCNVKDCSLGIALALGLRRPETIKQNCELL